MPEEKIEVEEGMLFAESIYGHNSNKGWVKLSYGITFEIKISPEETRAFARSVLEAAEAAETDELLMEWVEKRIGLKSAETKVPLLIDFRELREKMRRGEEIKARKKDGQK